MLTLATLHSPSPLTVLINFLHIKLQLGTQLIEVLHYKPERRGFDSRCCHWIFHWFNPYSCTMASGSTGLLTEMTTKNISWGGGGVKVTGALAHSLAAFMCRLSRNSMSINHVSANTRMWNFDLHKQRSHIYQSHYSQFCVKETRIIAEFTALTLKSFKTSRESIKKMNRRFAVVTVWTSEGIVDHHLTYNRISTVYFRAMTSTSGDAAFFFQRSYKHKQYFLER